LLTIFAVNLLKISFSSLNLFNPYSDFQVNWIKMGGREIEKALNVNDNENQNVASWSCRFVSRVGW
jgi:hypothetical protein